MNTSPSGTVSRICLLAFTLVLFSGPVLSQSIFQKSYGGASEEEFRSLVIAPDGSLYLGGSTESFAYGGKDIMLMKTDSAGNRIWTQHYGTTNDEDIGGALPIPGGAGNWLITGFNDDFGPGSINGSIYKVNASGGLTLSRNVGISLLEQYVSLDAAPDGSFVAAGFSFQGGLDGFVSRIDTGGNLVWSKTVGNSTTAELPLAARATLDNEVLVFGATSQGAGSDDAYINKLDSAGGLVWTRIFGESTQETVYDVVEIDTFLYLTGRTNFLGTVDLFLMKMTASGTELWTKVYGGSGSEIPWDMEVDGNGDILITGISDSFGAGNDDAFLLKVDSSGNRLWSMAYGGNQDEAGFKVLQAPDGGYFIAGRTETFGPGTSAAYLIKTDPGGSSGCNEATANFSTVDTAFTFTNPISFTSTNGGSINNKSHQGTSASDSSLTLCNAIACFAQARIELSDTAVCEGVAVLFADSTLNGISRNWLLNGSPYSSAQDSSFLGSPGTYQLTLIADDGSCQDTVSTTFSVNATPAFGLAPRDSLCPDDTISFNAMTSGATSYQWFLDNILYDSTSQTSFSTATPGTYTMSLVSNLSSCRKDTQFTVTQAPTAAFQSAMVSNFVYQFTDQSTGNPVSWQWDFGDGSAGSSMQSPQHTYSQNGNYLICLTVTNAFGCVDSTCLPISILVGLEPVKGADGWEIWPQPATNHLQLKTEHPGRYRVELYDLNGRSVLSESFRFEAHEQQKLELGSLPAGLYHFIIEGDGQRVHRKMMLLR